MCSHCLAYFRFESTVALTEVEERTTMAEITTQEILAFTLSFELDR